MLSVIVLMLLVVALLDWRISLAFIAFFIGLNVGIIALMTAYRVLDPRRMVLLTTDGMAGVDVVFR